MASAFGHGKAHGDHRMRPVIEDNISYGTMGIGDIFECLSALCAHDQLSSPQKSNPLFRRPPPPILACRRPLDNAVNAPLSFHLPADYRALYPASSLAYYLGASLEADDDAYIAFNSGDSVGLPDIPELEEWMGEALRKTFYLDCAVRYAAVSGGALNGLDVRELLGLPAKDIFNMGPGERFLLYSGVPDVPGLPQWHMAAYLDPVPESVEALPFLLHSLSAIYMPRSSPASERGVVSMSVRHFLGKPQGHYGPSDAAGRSIVVPSLREAGCQLWFSDGFPVDASKASARAFSNGQRHVRKGRNVSLGVICNEEAMAGEVDAIVDALSDTSASLEVCWDAGVPKFSRMFARGFDIVQLIGHCDERGFKCSDGFAKVCDIGENRTPMFFINSCSSYREAAALVERGSVCGIATLFRVLEEAAVDVCKDFYRMLGAGYPASIAIGAARECSALGKEYLLVGDGSFAPFGGDPLKPFYRITGRGDELALGCTMGNVDKGYVVSSWSPEGRKMVSDLGFESGPMEAEHLAAISEKFKGYCLYERSIYTSVREAAAKASRNVTRYRK